jgi:uncharacterized phage-associated protein
MSRSSIPPYDPRGLANTVLAIAGRYRIEISNLKLQKILYFLHAHYLVKFNKPLIRTSFEAWQYGPVIPHLYQALKAYGSGPITEQLTKVDPATGETKIAAPVIDVDVLLEIEPIAIDLMKQSAFQLVSVSHAENGPWDVVVKRSANGGSFAMRISDELIIEHHRNLKRSVSNFQPQEGQVHEDTPFARHGTG